MSLAMPVRKVTVLRSFKLGHAPGGGRRAEAALTEQSWMFERLQEQLREFGRALRAAGLRESSVHTYTDRTRRFLRWLVGDYEGGLLDLLVPRPEPRAELACAADVGDAQGHQPGSRAARTTPTLRSNTQRDARQKCAARARIQ